MQRIERVEAGAATGESKELLEGVRAKFGMVPNLTEVLAGSPAALKGYLDLSGDLAQGRLEAAVREQIALVVGQENACEYCLSAHTGAARALGLDGPTIAATRRASSDDPRIDAILKFARKIVRERAHLGDEDLEEVRTAGVSDEEILEVIANVAVSTFTNYVNHIAGTEVDFPRVGLELPESA